MPPSRVLGDRYELQAELGAGGMGTVYRARDRRTRKTVAIKMLHPHLSREPAYVERLRREAQIASDLDSRHVVQVLNFGQEQNQVYMVMEFVEGVTLGDALKQGEPLTELDAVLLGAQVARALEEAHSKGIIHRDIKPDNIIVQADGNVKVADFGIARVADMATLTATGGLVGSVHYMAPEALSGTTDPRSDIYSLGVVLYEALTATVPFPGETPVDVIRAHLEAQPRSPSEIRPEISEEVSDLVMACLAKDAEARPPSAADLRRSLEALAAKASPGDEMARRVRLPAAAATPGRRLPRVAFPTATSDLPRTIVSAGSAAVLGMPRLLARAFRGTILTLSVLGIVTLIVAAVLVIALLLAFLPGPDAAACSGPDNATTSRVTISADLARAFQEKWDGFNAALDRGEAASVSLTRDEVSSRAAFYLSERGNEKVTDVAVCFEPGRAIASASVSLDAGFFKKKVDVRAAGTVEFSDPPRLRFTDLKTGQLPVPGLVQGALSDVVNNLFTDLEVRHRYNIRFEYSGVTVDGEP